MFGQTRNPYSVSPIKSKQSIPQQKEHSMASDIEIAQKARLERISKIALAKLGIPEEHLEPYGHFKAKVSLDYLDGLKARPNAKLVLVTAMTPTPAGEGKTTTTVGLGDALNHIGKKAMICLREPSLGPVFGMKGGAAGGGYAQVVPMEDINLHFTGDFNAIALANNLLAAMLDNHIHHGNELGIDVRRIAWRRVVDMNDRARLQLRDRNELGDEAGRLRGHGSRLRRRPRRREIHRHQVPQVGPEALGRRGRGHVACAEVPRRCGPEDGEPGEHGCARARHRQSRAARREREQALRHPVRGVDQPLHLRYAARARLRQGANGE